MAKITINTDTVTNINSERALYYARFIESEDEALRIAESQALAESQEFANVMEVAKRYEAQENAQNLADSLKQLGSADVADMKRGQESVSSNADRASTGYVVYRTDEELELKGWAAPEDLHSETQLQSIQKQLFINYLQLQSALGKLYKKFIDEYKANRCTDFTKIVFQLVLDARERIEGFGIEIPELIKVLYDKYDVLKASGALKNIKAVEVLELYNENIMAAIERFEIRTSGLSEDLLLRQRIDQSFKIFIEEFRHKGATSKAQAEFYYFLNNFRFIQTFEAEVPEPIKFLCEKLRFLDRNFLSEKLGSHNFLYIFKDNIHKAIRLYDKKTPILAAVSNTDRDSTICVVDTNAEGLESKGSFINQEIEVKTHASCSEPVLLDESSRVPEDSHSRTQLQITLGQYFKQFIDEYKANRCTDKTKELFHLVVDNRKLIEGSGIEIPEPVKVLYGKYDALKASGALENIKAFEVLELYNENIMDAIDRFEIRTYGHSKDLLLRQRIDQSFKMFIEEFRYKGDTNKAQAEFFYLLNNFRFIQTLEAEVPDPIKFLCEKLGFLESNCLAKKLGYHNFLHIFKDDIHKAIRLYDSSKPSIASASDSLDSLGSIKIDSQDPRSDEHDASQKIAGEIIPDLEPVGQTPHLES